MREQEFLEQYLNLKYEIESMTERLARMEAQAQKTVSLLNQLRVSGTLDLRRFEAACIEEQEMVDELANKILAKTILYQEIVTTINSLPNPIHRQLLYNRYIDGLSPKEIANKYGYTERHERRLHRDALIGIRVPIQYKRSPQMSATSPQMSLNVRGEV